MDYERLLFEHFPVPKNLMGFVKNEIIQAQESLEFHVDNFEDQIKNRVNLDDLNESLELEETRILINVTETQLHLFRQAEADLLCGNNVLAGYLRDDKVKRLNLGVNQALQKGNKNLAKSKLKEMIVIRDLK